MTPEREKKIREELSVMEIGPFKNDLVNEILAEIDELRAQVKLFLNKAGELQAEKRFLEKDLAVAVEAFEEMKFHLCEGGGNIPCSQMWFQDVADEALSKIRGDK